MQFRPKPDAPGRLFLRLQGLWLNWLVFARRLRLVAPGRSHELPIPERFYAVSAERKVRHPALARIVESAKSGIFAS